MNYIPPVPSPPVLHFADRRVGELVAERPGRSRVFQLFGIDFCCQGTRTLSEACERKGVALEAVAERLEAEFVDVPSTESNPAELPADQLVEYILDRHHEFLRRELPRLHVMAERVAQVHGGETPSLVEIFELFAAAENELIDHMMKEEQVLFPAIVALCRGEQLPAGSLDGPINCMVDEHEEVAAVLARLRELSGDFRPPSGACNTYRALFAGLEDLEQDLNCHIHLENAVLFPATRELVKTAV